MNYIQQYYDEICAGHIVTSKKIKILYKHLTEKIKRPGAYFFDEHLADHAIEFVERYCKHSKGKSGGKPFILELWQKALISAIFGFVDQDGQRQYHEAVLIVARKNGKSAMGSAIALYCLFADGEAGPEVYSAATRKEQARIIWNEAVKMIRKSPALSRRSKCLIGEIKTDINEGIFRALASDSNNLDGLNVSCALLDEIHAWKDKNLYDVIVDGMTAREQPLTIITTTAGTVRESIFDIKYEECERILNGYETGLYTDDRILPVIYELDGREEWTEPAAWYKANPGLGTIKKWQQLAEKVERAKNNDAFVKNLLCKDFNLPQSDIDAFLTIEEATNAATYSLDEIVEQDGEILGVGGFDLSQTTDITSACILFKRRAEDEEFCSVSMCWIPEELFEKRCHEDKAPYDIWKKRGWLRLCEGNRINYHDIFSWFREMEDEHNITFFKIGYDRYSAQYLTQEIADYYGPAILDEVIQGARTLSLPLQDLKAALQKNRINYNNNPIMQWCLCNLKIKIDENGNFNTVKNRNGKVRDDAAMALLDAYTIYLRYLEEYENGI